MGFLKAIKDMKNTVAETPGLIEQAQQMQQQAQQMQAAQMAAAQAAAAQVPGSAGAVDPQLLEPISGVTLEDYARLSKAIGERKLDQAGIDSFVELQGITPDAWKAAYEGWNARFKGNMALAVHYGTLYQQARSY
jgi:hypothetical protein